MAADEIAEREARLWLGYCLAWARRMERKHPDPVGFYRNAATRGLLDAIRITNRPDGSIHKKLLDACLFNAGRAETVTQRRRASRSTTLPFVEGSDDELPAIGRLAADPVAEAIFRELLARESR